MTTCLSFWCLKFWRFHVKSTNLVFLLGGGWTWKCIPTWRHELSNVAPLQVKQARILWFPTNSDTPDSLTSRYGAGCQVPVVILMSFSICRVRKKITMLWTHVPCREIKEGRVSQQWLKCRLIFHRTRWREIIIHIHTSFLILQREAYKPIYSFSSRLNFSPHHWDV